MTDDSTLDKLSDLIDEAFDKAFGRSVEKSETTPAPYSKEQPLNPLYESIEDYTEKTGKRFRMTKDQKERTLTREEAFSEFTNIENEILGELN
jgi:hypothetical protein